MPKPTKNDQKGKKLSSKIGSRNPQRSTSSPAASKTVAKVKSKVILFDSDPVQIRSGAPDLSAEATNCLNVLLHAQNFGRAFFDNELPHSEDWAMLFVIIANDAEGRATVTKNIVEVTGRAYGTIRAALVRFENLGYIVSQQRIGRSELYVPTEKLKEYLNEYAKSFWSHVASLSGQTT